MGLPAITTESDEMKVAGLLVPHERFRHGNIVPLHPCLSETWGTLIVTYDSDLGHRLRDKSFR